jgi:hypothetical protein
MEASSEEEQEVEVIEERVKAPKKEKAKKELIKQEIVVKENPFFNY